MHTRMGTAVAFITSIDCEGYCSCGLLWEDGSSDVREIHISDLRAEDDKDQLELLVLSQSASAKRVLTQKVDRALEERIIEPQS